MIGLNNLQPKPGATHSKKRLGCGSGSGHGQTCTRGQKGQNSTSGGSKPAGFEGGQMPLLRRIPKSGFNNVRFANRYAKVNVGALGNFFVAGSDVTPQILRDKGVVKGTNPVKILGDGDITVALKVSADSFSEGAKEKIEKAGGTVSLIEKAPRREKK